MSKNKLIAKKTLLTTKGAVAPGEELPKLPTKEVEVLKEKDCVEYVEPSEDASEGEDIDDGSENQDVQS